jgi:hypothetical protein
VTINLDPLQLISGTYYAEAHFLDELDSMAIIGGRSDWFYVKGLGFSYEDSTGVYEPRSSWGHQVLTQDGLDGGFPNDLLGEASILTKKVNA